MGYVILQALTALFATVGVFELLWHGIVFCMRRSLRCRKVRILLYADDAADPVLLTEQWSLLLGDAAKGNGEVWIVCAPGSPVACFRQQEEARQVGVTVLSPDEAAELVREET